MNIVGTGLSGLVGSRITELLSPKYTFVNFSLETGVDITNRDVITEKINHFDAPWMFHLAAYTNVQKAEEEKDSAWSVNVDATENIVSACKSTDKRLLYIDTDYAFDGTRKEGYEEDDIPNPLGWYAKTKSEGARRVLAYTKGLVIRIANPYRANPVGKMDFVHKMLKRMANNQEIVAPSDQLFVPTFVDDIAGAIEKLISLNATGVYHVVGSQALSPYEAAKIIATTFGYNGSLVKETTFAEYFSGRAPVPQYAVLHNAKINTLGFVTHSFSDGILLVKQRES